MFNLSNQPIIYDPAPCWILAHWRSGSYYLASLLNTTDRFEPHFDEWLCGGYDLDEEPWKRPWPKWRRFGESITKEQVLQTLPPYLKIHPVNYWSLFTTEDKEQIEAALPGLRYIWLRRRDLMATTASFYLSRHTDHWVAYEDDEVNKHAAIQVPLIRKELAYDYSEVIRWQTRWEDYLQGSPRLEIYYEDIIDNPEKINEVLNFLGVDDEKPWWEYATKKFRHPQAKEVRELLEDVIANGEHEKFVEMH